ncbi:PucR family transcriptional regulator [Bifidobacterium olomucense]|uniref:Purine catabolism regulatory protein-like family n=1 Tax=Bifidobacterium olomucense TaxID=2675324 RepID=A0A7Y0EZB1_9BIFI|nr:PucR family transcriptional regulator [Bifidobacterium sp. DSM 109959]NMM99159.1 Purine catabolism regulatory protein-like family [Bifidobacterium sp. DSM 109959]
MTVRLKDLVEQAADQDMVLVAGKGGLERPVRWVHMVENEEIAGFLEGQEIAFTTGIGLETQEDLYPLVKSAYASGASGVVVNIGPFIHQISPETVRFCDDHDFPLFKVPWSVHMAQIMHSFSLAITMSEKHSMELAAALENAIFHPDREEMYLEYLEQSGFGKDWNYCVTVFSACAEAGRGGQSSHNADLTAKYSREAESLITRKQWRVAVVHIEDRLVLVFARYTAEQVELMIREIIAAIRGRGIALERTYIGVGKVTRSARCIGKSYNQALKLERLQHLRGRVGEIALYDNSGIDKLLLAVSDRAILEDYYQDSIGPLVEYDRVNGTDLTETLRAYFQFSGSVKETAASMFVHRNTVSYKLNKIEDILGVSLSDFRTREFLSVGLQVREVLDC